MGLYVAKGDILHEYTTKAKAEKKQRLMKKMYGHIPNIIENITEKGELINYIVVEPKNLKKLRRLI
jgi:hypothetical protein